MKILVIRTVSDVIEVPDDWKFSTRTIGEIASSAEETGNNAVLTCAVSEYLDEISGWPAISESQVDNIEALPY